MCRSQANHCGNFNCSLKYSVRSILDLFQGIGTMFAQSPQIAIARVVLIFLGFLLVYLGVKGTLEPLIMVPMGLGMSAVNAGVLFLGENQIGNLIIDPLLSTTDELMTYMQINFLQPIYNLTFSNGLIACLVFMGIGILCDIGYVLEHPFISMTIALFAELGTVATYPIARAMGLDAGSSAAVSIIGGADGPMVLFCFVEAGTGAFRPDLDCRVSVLKSYLWWLSIPDQTSDPERNAWKADSEREESEQDPSKGEDCICSHYKCAALPVVPGCGTAVFEFLRGNRNPRDRNLCVHQDDRRKFPVFCNVLLRIDAWSSV